jgi:hypothetical protein
MNVLHYASLNIRPTGSTNAMLICIHHVLYYRDLQHIILYYTITSYNTLMSESNNTI